MTSSVTPPNLRMIQGQVPWVDSSGKPTPYFFRLLNSLVNGVNAPSPGIYNPTFQSGYVIYTGPNGTLAGSPSFQFGSNLPNPSGIPGNALFLGADAGSGVQISTWIITDQAQDVNTPGPILGMTAGEAQPNSSEPGGLLWFIGGGASNGTGGGFLGQGGTSLGGNGGPATLQGGNSTDGIPGDAFVVGGEEGTQGANVQLLATTINGISGVIRHRWNSNFVWDEYVDGSWFFYNGGEFGTAGQALISGGPGEPVAWASIPAGVTGEVQYNVAGVLGADASFAFDPTTKTLEFENEILTGAVSDQSYTTVVALTGGATTAPDAKQTLLLNPAATIATFAVTMPPNPIDGQIFELSSTQTVSTLTMTANAAQSIQNSTVAGSITIASFGVTNGASWRYILGLTQWVRRY